MNMCSLGDQRCFRYVQDGSVVFKRGIIVGKTFEENPKYDFKVGDRIYNLIEEKYIIGESE